MKILLAATTQSLFDAWRRNCGDLDCVEIRRSSILELECDAVVSPANSFGFMDGGIDAIYLDHFGRKIQDRLRWAILTRHQGELLVGQAELVQTGHARIPYLIAAPTMRVPMMLPENTINPYLATRAALLLTKYGEFGLSTSQDAAIQPKIGIIAFPGLGTGVGQVPAALCARQMRAAIIEFQKGRLALPTSWAEASEEHQRLYTDEPRPLQ